MNKISFHVALFLALFFPAHQSNSEPTKLREVFSIGYCFVYKDKDVGGANNNWMHSPGYVITFVPCDSKKFGYQSIYKIIKNKEDYFVSEEIGDEKILTQILIPYSFVYRMEFFVNNPKK